MAVIKYKGQTYGGSSVPIATESAPGAVQVDGATLGIKDGVIFVTGLSEDILATDNDIQELFNKEGANE